MLLLSLCQQSELHRVLHRTGSDIEVAKKVKSKSLYNCFASREKVKVQSEQALKSPLGMVVVHKIHFH